jgi:hypothetical protein
MFKHTKDILRKGVEGDDGVTHTRGRLGGSGMGSG